MRKKYIIDELRIKKILSNDRSECEGFYKEFLPFIKNIIRRRVNGISFEECEDMSHDVLIKSLNKLYTYKDYESCIQSWISTIAKNHTYDYFRKRKIEFVKLDRENEYRLTDLSIGFNRESDLIDTEKKELLNTLFIEILEPKQKDILVDKYFNGLSQKEISKKMNIPIGTVGCLVSRALLKGRKEIVKRNIKISDLMSTHY